MTTHHLVHACHLSDCLMIIIRLFDKVTYHIKLYKLIRSVEILTDCMTSDVRVNVDRAHHKVQTLICMFLKLGIFKCM